MVKLAEHTCGTHIYMRMMLNNKRIEEIDVYIGQNGEKTYKTSADPGGHLEVREQIIEAFKKLY